MSGRFLILLVSTLLLFQVVTSQSLEFYEREKRLCNNPVIDWLHLNLFEVNNLTLNESLVIFKSFLENDTKNSSSRAELPGKFLQDVSEFMRDLEAERNANPKFNPKDAFTAVEKLLVNAKFYDEAERLDVNTLARRKKFIEQFRGMFEQFAATVPRSKRGKYKELFTFRDQFANVKDVWNQFMYLTELDRICTK